MQSILVWRIRKKESNHNETGVVLFGWYEMDRWRKKVVCVTGASGFIGSWLVCLLLKRGYVVHGTVENIYDPQETRHLKALPGARDRLKLFQIHLLDYDSIFQAILGCQGVFHVASPTTYFYEDVEDPQVELVDPAGLGTLNVLEASYKANVKRVVLTSCMSAVFHNPNWPSKTDVDESSWSSIEFCKTNKIWYSLSKTLAERAAWIFAKANKIDMVTILPSLCFGHLLQPRLNASSAVLLRLLQGSKDSPLQSWSGCVHVKDVANAHILLYETPSASGRYLCTNSFTQYRDFAETAAKLFPEYTIKSLNDTQNSTIRCKNASEKLRSLGFEFIPIEDAIKESMFSLKDKGFLE